MTTAHTGSGPAAPDTTAAGRSVPGGPPHRREPSPRRGSGARRAAMASWEDGDARPGHPQQGARSWDRERRWPPSDRGDTGRDRRHSAPGTPSDRREGAGAPFRRAGWNRPAVRTADRLERAATGDRTSSAQIRHRVRQCIRSPSRGGSGWGGHPPGSRGAGLACPRTRRVPMARVERRGIGPAGRGRTGGDRLTPDEDQRPGETRGSGEGDAARPGRPVVVRGPGGPRPGPWGPRFTEGREARVVAGWPAVSCARRPGARTRQQAGRARAPRGLEARDRADQLGGVHGATPNGRPGQGFGPRPAYPAGEGPRPGRYTEHPEEARGVGLAPRRAPRP